MADPENILIAAYASVDGKFVPMFESPHSDQRALKYMGKARVGIEDADPNNAASDEVKDWYVSTYETLYREVDAPGHVTIGSPSIDGGGPNGLFNKPWYAIFEFSNDLWVGRFFEGSGYQTTTATGVYVIEATLAPGLVGGERPQLVGQQTSRSLIYSSGGDAGAGFEGEHGGSGGDRRDEW